MNTLQKNLLIPQKALEQSSQLIWVTTEDWDTVSASIRFYERDKDRRWKAVSKPFPAVVGKNGMAWGRGLHGWLEEPGKQKQEGDGKSPAGVFALGKAFGFAPAVAAEWIRLPYLHITQKWECVDDADSAHYNEVLENKHPATADWDSSEKMRAVGDEYEWGIVVQHNTTPVEAGYGSCIFLHIWQDHQTGTAGCTAMEKSRIEHLLRRLDPVKHPLLIQLPQEYDTLRKQILTP